MRATLDLPPELVEAIAERAAELVAEQIDSRNGDGWLRGADAIAGYIGAKRDRVYALSSAGRIPVEHDGSALLARKSVLDAWVRNGGGKRP
jgi:hypothetical protein